MRRATWCSRRLRDASSFVRFVDGVQRPEGDRPDPLRGGVRDQGRLPEIQVQRDRRGHARRGASGEIEAKIEGTPLGVVGRLTAKSHHQARETPATRPRSTYSVEATLAGKLGSIGQPVLRSKAKDMEKQFAQRLRAAFAQATSEATNDSLRSRRTDIACGGDQAARSRTTPRVRPIAGGTALMLMMKAGVFSPEKLVSLRKIEKQIFQHRGRRRRPAHRRHDDAVGAGAFRRCEEARARHHPHAA